MQAYAMPLRSIAYACSPIRWLQGLDHWSFPWINSVGIAVKYPSSPSEPPFGPAVKYSSAAGEDAASRLLGLTFPGLSAQSPLIARGLPAEFSSRPSKWPEVRL